MYVGNPGLSAISKIGEGGHSLPSSDSAGLEECTVTVARRSYGFDPERARDFRFRETAGITKMIGVVGSKNVK